MTPGARIQATIELLDSIFASWRTPKRIPADKLLENYFKSHRYIGSKDRGAIAELVYWCLRHRAGLEWWMERCELPEDYARGMALGALMLRRDYTPQNLPGILKDSQYSPSPLLPLEENMVARLAGESIEHPDMPDYIRLNYPEWMDEYLRESFGTDFEAALHALNEQASTDLRVNTLKTDRESLRRRLSEEGFNATPSPLSATGLRLDRRGPIFASPAFREGLFEVQDDGSQALAQLVDARPGHKVIDFCAGAGGKTLAMAASMENKGRILAWDTSEKRLAQMTLRLRRAGVHNVQPHVLSSEHDAFIKRHKASADRVLVDAPCSGTGTWRRNPDLKWRFTPHDLEDIRSVQARILESAARLVKPGGKLIYATCSVLKDENERQVAHLLKNINHFKVVCAQKIWDKTQPQDHADPVSFFWVTPHQDGVDGFFAAVLERTA